VPNDYASQADYETRVLLESSRAVQCPGLTLQLAGAKKVQEVLTHPGMLERFLAPSEGAATMRDTWTRMWSLGAGGRAGAEEAGCRAHDLVLKPRREGGGNSVYSTWETSHSWSYSRQSKSAQRGNSSARYDVSPGISSGLMRGACVRTWRASLACPGGRFLER